MTGSAWRLWGGLALAGGPWVGSTSVLAGCGDAGCDNPVQVGPIDVCVTLAVTAAERLAGLRGHAPLASDEGLLIRFPVEGEVCLVNDGVSFPIDAVLLDTSHRVTHVLSLAANDPTPRCASPARDVLELAAGLAQNLPIDTLGALP